MDCISAAYLPLPINKYFVKDNERHMVKGNKAPFKVWGWKCTRGAWDVFSSQKKQQQQQLEKTNETRQKKQLERSSTGKRWNNLGIKKKNDGS